MGQSATLRRRDSIGRPYPQFAVMSAPVQVNGGFTNIIQVTGEEAGSTQDKELFDSSLLTGLDTLQSPQIPFPNGLTVSSPGEGLRVRPLCVGDWNRGFLELLGQLTTVGEISRDQWEDRFSQMKAGTGTYFVVVLEDVGEARVVGAATLVVEKKFIHECGQVGRVEDVVVSDQYRGRQLGKLVVGICSLLAYRLHCYKVTLNLMTPCSNITLDSDLPLNKATVTICVSGLISNNTLQYYYVTTTTIHYLVLRFYSIAM